MKKKLALFTVLVVLTLGCFSKQKVQETKTNHDKSLLYSISGNGLNYTSYLFGTIHLIPEDKYFLPANTREALWNSMAIMMEIDINIPIKEQLELANKMLIPEGKSLSDFLSNKDYAKFERFLKDSLDMNEGKIARYSRFKPFFLPGLLLKEYYDKVESYEQYFNKYAKKSNKELLSLETLDEQLAIVDTVPIDVQAGELLSTNFINDYKELLKCYTEENLDCLEEEIQSLDDKSIEEIFITHRNKNWLPKIQGEISKKSVFIAVGAAHLVGETGLIQLLRDAGYTIKPIFSPADE